MLSFQEKRFSALPCLSTFRFPSRHIHIRRPLSFPGRSTYDTEDLRPLNSELIVAHGCPAVDRFNERRQIQTFDCISVGYDEDCGIEEPDIHMMRFHSLAGVRYVQSLSAPAFVSS